MDDLLKIEDYKNLLASMDRLCEIMPEIIYFNYFDSNKYLFTLYDESFKSIKGFCVLLGNGALVAQACAVLRMSIESISTIRILEKYPQLLNEYIEHWKFRFQIKEEKKQRDLIYEHYKDKIPSLDKRRALDFLDYGWIMAVNPDFGFHQLIKTAGFDEKPDNFYSWIDTLNMWVHGTVTSVNIMNGDDAIKYSHGLIDIAAKLLDIICCEFHNNTKISFVVNNFDYFNDFRNDYKKTQSSN